MASAIFTPPYLPHTSSPTIFRKPTLYVSLTTSHISYSKNPIFRSLTWVPQLGLASFSDWNGLKPNGFSISLQSLRFERRRKCKGKGVFASLFGVGAPEALVIGVVALLVFGPKGLAEVAKNLGQTLRAFQPTIRELQEVSREFKSTLEKEIGLDELKNPPQGNYTSNVETLSSSPLLDAAPENSQAIATETSPAVTPEDSQATETTPAVTTENTQETSTAPVITAEDSQPNVHPTNGSPSSNAYASEEILNVTEEQSKASTSSDPLTPSQDTVQEVAAGMPLTQKSKTEI